MALKCGHCDRTFRSRKRVAAHVKICRVANLELALEEIKKATREIVAQEVNTLTALVNFVPEPGSWVH